jgi:hypothetical protein
MNHIIASILAHKQIVIAVGAVALVAAYVVPYDSIIQASAANGNNGNNNNNAAGGHPTNPNAYKVCEHNTTPKKCYGNTPN